VMLLYTVTVCCHCVLSLYSVTVYCMLYLNISVSNVLYCIVLFNNSTVLYWVLFLYLQAAGPGVRAGPPRDPGTQQHYCSEGTVL